MDQLKNQPCPVCHANKLTLTEENYNVPYFGRCYLMAMQCEACGYKMSDIESEETKDPVKYTFEVKNKKDLNVRVVKSGQATIKIPVRTATEDPKYLLIRCPFGFLWLFRVSFSLNADELDFLSSLLKKSFGSIFAEYNL